MRLRRRWCTACRKGMSAFSAERRRLALGTDNSRGLQWVNRVVRPTVVSIRSTSRNGHRRQTVSRRDGAITGRTQTLTIRRHVLSVHIKSGVGAA